MMLPTQHLVCGQFYCLLPRVVDCGGEEFSGDNGSLCFVIRFKLCNVGLYVAGLYKCN